MGAWVQLQGSADCSLQTPSGPPPVLYDLQAQNGLHIPEELKKIKKEDFVTHEIQISGSITDVLLEHSHAHLHTANGCFGTATAEELPQRPCVFQSLKDWLSGPSHKVCGPLF